MKRESSDNTNNTTSGNQWARGTKIQQKQSDQFEQVTREQPIQRDSDKNLSKQSHKYIPKLKERNPFSAYRQISEKGTEQEINQEINSLLQTFNTQQYNISEFMAEVIKGNDQYSASNHEVVDYILSQTKIKEFFRGLIKQQTTLLTNSLLHSIRNNLTYQNKEASIRMLGHLLYEDNEIDNNSLNSIYQVISKMAFESGTTDTSKEMQQNTGSSGGSTPQSSQKSKLQRLALNCLANMFSKPSTFLKQNSDGINLKLKSLFEQQMKKIQVSYKSKRYISMLTTVIRALQLSMNECQKSITNDTECIRLFLHFYKLLFLGSPFTEKMLNIKFEESKQKSKNQQLIQIQDEELKSDSGSFLIDTSDISSDGSEGSKFNKNSPNSDAINSGDPYQKIKTYAALCLQYLFKNNNKALFNYWYLMFPSYFMRQNSELSQYLQTFNSKEQEFFDKISSIITREPTIFYLLRAKENNSKLKCTIGFTLSIMLENQMIQKWQGQLEKEQQSITQSQQQFVSMSNILGQFLRFLHYQIIYLIQSETDVQLLGQIIKTAGALMHITPYSKMNKGLSSTLVSKLFSKLISKDTDAQTKTLILNTLSIAFNISDISEELDNEFLSNEDLLSSLFKHEIVSDYVQQTPEFITFIQRIAKNYPSKVLAIYETIFNDYLRKLIKNTDKKKVINGLKIIEEWLKNYKQSSLIQDDDEEQEEEKQENMSQQPYAIQEFKNCLNQIVNKTLLNKQYHQNDVSISILSMMSNIDSNQWKQTFSQETTSRILNYLYSAKNTPLLRAASIKFLGYLVYYDLTSFDQNFFNQVYSLVIENASDTNQNVQIRNSWALANLSFIQNSFQDEYLAQEVLIISLNYAMSNKEKVSSNGIRSLGYFLQKIDIPTLKNSIIPSIKKSSLQLQKLNPNISGILSLDSIFLQIIDNLESKSPKIAWNSCVAIAKILENTSVDESELIYSEYTINPLLRALEKSSNFKTKIHAAQTLLKFKSTKPFQQNQQIVFDYWTALMNSLEQLNKTVYTTSDLKYAQNLELSILQLWQQFAGLHMIPAFQEIYENGIKNFINKNSLVLLQVFTDYLRKELKIPEYSAMFDKELLLKEAEILFKENENLEKKLILLKSVITKIRDTIKSYDSIHVSFGVFESFNMLANTEVNEISGLELLKGTKTSFQPSFDDQ